ncbi:YraN family protein [Sulfurovum zhangzhouensis]
MSRKIGDKSAELATGFLERNGFVIVERNYYASKLGEIDIIATKESVLHFIEVKSSYGDFDPVDNITPSKLKKVINSAYYYLKTKGLASTFCIDALLIRKDEVELIENITL